MARRSNLAAQTTTIADVARLAGVSTATVSRTLTSPSVVTKPTRERVLQAIGRTGYAPNAAARMLRLRRSNLVMVVVPDIANPFFSEVLRGIDETLSAANYGLVVANLDRSTAKDAHYVGLAGSGQVDGVILLCGRMPGRGERTIGALGIPVVAGCEIIPRAAIPQVDVANRDAARAATTHLLELGHRRLAYVAGPARNILERERRAGFWEALDQAGIARREATVCAGDFTFASGAAAAVEMLALPAEHRPTGVFAANDEMAIGLMKRMREHGLAVPCDLSVVGFDAIAFSDYCEPALTTVRQPRPLIGATAARLLIEAIDGGTSDRGTLIRLPAELIVRGTTGPPPAISTARSARNGASGGQT